MGVCRTPEELEEDVGLMLQHTNRIRLYSTECPDVMHGLLKKASEGQLSLLLGVWMENNQRDHAELDMLMKYLEQYPYAALEGIVIGNEVRASIVCRYANGLFSRFFLGDKHLPITWPILLAKRETGWALPIRMLIV